jgi:hypothetical protein
MISWILKPLGTETLSPHTFLSTIEPQNLVWLDKSSSLSEPRPLAYTPSYLQDNLKILCDRRILKPLETETLSLHTFLSTRQPQNLVWNPESSTLSKPRPLAYTPSYPQYNLVIWCD